MLARRRLTADHDLMLADLVFARQVLDEMLPSGPLCGEAVHVAGRLLPAEKVGGDLYSYAQDATGHINFMLADAVGHGLGSTLLVFECRAMWRALSMGRVGVGERIRLLNELLFENTGAERFVACCAGAVEQTSGKVELAVCGVSPLFHYRSRWGDVILLEDSDPPLGLFRDTEFRLRSLQLEEGDSLLAVTDGVLEWEGSAAEEFGDERLLELFARHADGGPETVLDAIFSQLSEYSGERSQRDDACALVIRRSAAVGDRVASSSCAVAEKPEE